MALRTTNRMRNPLTQRLEQPHRASHLPVVAPERRLMLQKMEAHAAAAAQVGPGDVGLPVPSPSQPQNTAAGGASSTGSGSSFSAPAAIRPGWWGPASGRGPCAAMPQHFTSGRPRPRRALWGDAVLGLTAAFVALPLLTLLYHAELAARGLGLLGGAVRAVLVGMPPGAALMHAPALPHVLALIPATAVLSTAPLLLAAFAVHSNSMLAWVVLCYAGATMLPTHVALGTAKSPHRAGTAGASSAGRLVPQRRRGAWALAAARTALLLAFYKGLKHGAIADAAGGLAAAVWSLHSIGVASSYC